MDWSALDPAFRALSRPARHDHFLDAIATLPLQTVLKAWGFSFDDERLRALYRAGVALNKSFDNFEDEALIAEGDRGLALADGYYFEQFSDPAPGTLLSDYVREVGRKGIDPADAVAILVAVNNGLTNTLSVSTAFALRNLLRHPEAVAPLRRDPSLVDDQVVMEFLRRDNHVKSLSRQVHAPVSLRGFALRPGDAISIFYPAVNMDPGHWRDPARLDFERGFTRDNHYLFGGTRYACIGSRLALQYFRHALTCMLAAIPATARIVEDDIETDSAWLTERIITRLPILVS